MRLPVEIAARDERCWRLSSAVAPNRLVFEREIPLPPGTHVRARFSLPGVGALAIDAPGRVEAPDVIALAPDPETRAALVAALAAEAEEGGAWVGEERS